MESREFQYRMTRYVVCKYQLYLALIRFTLFEKTLVVQFLSIIYRRLCVRYCQIFNVPF